MNIDLKSPIVDKIVESLSCLSILFEHFLFIIVINLVVDNVSNALGSVELINC